MTGTTESLPMDVAEDARGQLEQQQQKQRQEGEDHKKEVDRNESVRARLLTLSQVAPEGEALPLNLKSSPRGQNPPSDREDEFRRKLMSISYVEVGMSTQ